MSRKYENISTEKGTTLTQTGKPRGNGSYISVPKKWCGKRVKITIIDDTTNSKVDEQIQCINDGKDDNILGYWNNKRANEPAEYIIISDEMYSPKTIVYFSMWMSRKYKLTDICIHDQCIVFIEFGNSIPVVLLFENEGSDKLKYTKFKMKEYVNNEFCRFIEKNE